MEEIDRVRIQSGWGMELPCPLQAQPPSIYYAQQPGSSPNHTAR